MSDLAAPLAAVLAGRDGPVPARVAATVVDYARMVGASELVPLTGPGHFSISAPLPGTAVPMGMLHELVAAGMRTPLPFTLDPHPPLDFDALGASDAERQDLARTFADADAYHAGMLALGLRERDAYTCTPYVHAAGNVPRRGEVLAWSESSAVIYANSVIAARTNRNAAILDLFQNLLGVAPRFGLLTDAGRRATWRVEIATARLPHPQLLGAAIGRAVVDGVPYVAGLDRFLADVRAPATRDYLKEAGAAMAAIGAVGLVHVEGVTPEACEQGPALLAPGHAALRVDDARIAAERARRPVVARDAGPPDRCLIGCPHLSLRELGWWADRLEDALVRAGRDRLAVETILVAAPFVLREAVEPGGPGARLLALGARLSGSCAEDFLASPVCGAGRIVTSSAKLEAYTGARMFPDEELADLLATGGTAA